MGTCTWLCGITAGLFVLGVVASICSFALPWVKYVYTPPTYEGTVLSGGTGTATVDTAQLEKCGSAYRGLWYESKDPDCTTGISVNSLDKTANIKSFEKLSLAAIGTSSIFMCLGIFFLICLGCDCLGTMLAWFLILLLSIGAVISMSVGVGYYLAKFKEDNSTTIPIAAGKGSYETEYFWGIFMVPICIGCAAFAIILGACAIFEEKTSDDDDDDHSSHRRRKY